MKLYVSPTSPFARLCVIAALRGGHQALELAFVLPWTNPEALLQVNPYCQVPTLACDDGGILSESVFIMQHLDPRVMTDEPRKSAFAFSTINFVVRAYSLALHGDAQQPHPHVERCQQALLRALPRCPELHPESESWGDICLGAALNYTALRLPELYQQAVSASLKEAVKRFNQRDFMLKTEPSRLELQPATIADL